MGEKATAAVIGILAAGTIIACSVAAAKNPKTQTQQPTQTTGYITKTKTSTQPYNPFQPQQTPFLPESIVENLEENIASMGAQGPKDYTLGPTPIRVEEQYEVNERYALATTTTPTYYDVKTTEPKEILLVADGADHYVDFNMQISSDSPKLFNGGSLSITSKGVIRIWAQTVTAANSTLRILVFKR